MGFFKTDTPVELPNGLKHLFNPRWLAVTLARYLEGTLCYDELLIGSLTRRGVRIGVFVHHIWVNDHSSLLGGRRIWGLPKEMADFAWDGNMVRVTDEKGSIVTLTIEESKAWLPRIWVLAPSIGQLNGQWTFTMARLWAQLGGVRIHLGEWSSRFACRPSKVPVFAFAAKSFDMTVLPPKLCSD